MAQIDVATLGIKVTTSGVTEAQSALQGLNKAGAQTEVTFSRVEKSTTTAGAGIKSLRGPLAALTTNLLQLNPAAATATSILSVMALGTGATVGILAGIAAISLAYSKLTEETRKAAAEQEKSIQALRDLQRVAGAGLGGQLTVDLENARASVAGLQKSLSALSSTGGIRERLEEIGKFLGFSTRSDKLAEQTKLIGAGQEEYYKKLGQTTGAIALQIEKQTALNSVFGTGQLAIDLINNKYEYKNALLKNSVGTTAAERAALDGLAGVQKKAADAAAVFADNLRKSTENTDLLAKLKALNEQVAKLGQSLGATSIQLTPGSPFFTLLSGGSSGGTESEENRAARVGGAYLRSQEQIKRSLEDQLRLIDDSVRGAVQLGEAFGVVSRNVGDIITGLTQVATGLPQLNKALSSGSSFDIVSAALPVAGGFASAISGLINAAHEQQEAARRLREAAEAFRSSVRDFTNPASTSAGQRFNAVQNQFDQVRKGLDDLFRAGGLGVAEADKVIKQLNASLAAQKAQVIADYFADLGQQLNALNGPAGEFQNALDDIQKKFIENTQAAKELGLGEAGLATAQEIRRRSTEALINAEANAAGITQDLLQRYSSLTGATINSGDQFASLRKAIADAEAQGLTDLAESLRQTLKMDEAFKAQLDAIEEQKRANEAAEKARQEMIQAQQEQVSILEDSLRAQEQAVNGLRDTVEALRKYSDSLKLSNLSPLSSAQRYAAASGQFDALVAKAFGGDQNAVKAITSGGADSFLQESRNRFASGGRYVSDYNRVQGVVGGLEGLFGTQLDTQDKILEELKKQTDIAEEQLEAQTGKKKPLTHDQAVAEAAKGAFRSSAEDILYYSAGGGSGANIYPAGLVEYLTKNVWNGNTLHRDPDGQYYWIGGKSHSRQDAEDNSVNPIPLFGWGGAHHGGLRIVGDRGPEVERTGPSRVDTAEQFQAPVVKALGRIEYELRALKTETRLTGAKMRQLN